MHYIIENAYTKKLYEQLKGKVFKLQLLGMMDVATLDPGHAIIVDEDDFESFITLHDAAREVVVLTEKSPHPIPTLKNVRYVRKYQSTRNILTLVTMTAFPITFLVFATKSTEYDAIIKDVAKKYDIDTIISLDFSPNSSFSLFDCLTRINQNFLNHAILDVITTIQDYLNPPTSALIDFLNQLKGKSRLLIVSAPLKGALDSAVIELSDTIILVENDAAMKLEPHLSHRMKSKHFEVMTYD